MRRQWRYAAPFRPYGSRIEDLAGLTGSLTFSGSHGSIRDSGTNLLPKADEGPEEEAFPVLEVGRSPRLSKRFFVLHRDIPGESLSKSDEEELSKIFMTGVC